MGSAALFVYLSAIFMAAGPYDPAIEYRTVHGTHVRVHYPKDAFNLAVRIERLAEDILVADQDRLNNRPDGIVDIVLTDNTDEANGSAAVVPKNTLRLNLAAPIELTGLSQYEDWLRMLLTHELAHIVDIDQAWGFTRALRPIFGRALSFNGFSPQFLSEGVAVWVETKNTSTGRGRSSYVEALLRCAALGDNFLHIDQAHILFARFPFGNAAYFYGGRFHLYLSERLGDARVAALHRYYASQIVPFFYSFGAQKIYGTSIETLWQDFKNNETAYAREVAKVVADTAITAARPLTHEGGDLQGAHYDPFGKQIVYGRRSSIDGSTVRMRARQGAPQSHDTTVLLDTYSPRFAFAPDGQAIFFSRGAITHTFDTFGDIYRVPWVAGGQRRGPGRILKLRDVNHPNQSLRARDPAISPDGKHLVFVRNHLHQSYLAVADVSDVTPKQKRWVAPIRQLVGPVADVQHATPSFSPDGKLIAESVWFMGGKRDIVLIDATTGEHRRRVTFDDALDGSPSFSPDGRYMFYDSDSEGISNIYAYELATDLYFKVTNVVGGAFSANVAPDQSTLLFRGINARGFDLYEMSYDPNGFVPMAYLGEGGYRPKDPKRQTAEKHDWADLGVKETLRRQDEPKLALLAHERDTAYHAWPTLRPLNDNWVLIPSLYIFNNDPGLAFVTVGQDSLARHTYQLSLGASYYGRSPNVGLTYINDRYRPSIGVGASYNAVAYAVAEGLAVQKSLGAGVSWSYPLYNRHVLVAGYSFSHLYNDALANKYLSSGNFAALQLGYSYGFAHSFAYSISQEHGRGLGVGATYFSRALGASFDELLLSVDSRLYVNNPLFDNHVLAMRFVGSYALGPDYKQAFFLYGHQGASLFTAQTGQLYPLRGFLPGQMPFGSPDTGTAIVAGYVEYRLPLWHIQRGLFSWPIYFQHLHAAAFADVGNTFGFMRGRRTLTHVSLGQALRHLWLGTGVEARLDFTLGWNTSVTSRVGVAVPALAGGMSVIDRFAPTVYVDVGTLI